jgi:O-antigen ligase
MHYLVRKGIWGNTLVVIHDHPVFGIGIDQFQGLAEPRYPIYYYNVVMEQVHTHQLYLQMLTDFGIPGGSLFILLFLSVFLIGVQNIRLSRTRTSILLLLAYTVILLHGLVDIPLLYSRGGFLLWTIMGCIVGHYNWLKQAEAPDAEPV